MAKEMSDREKYLLKAILYLLLYSGLGENADVDSKVKPLLLSGTNPITDYGRSKTMMAG